jgi:hypothetical protein
LGSAPNSKVPLAGQGKSPFANIDVAVGSFSTEAAGSAAPPLPLPPES